MAQKSWEKVLRDVVQRIERFAMLAAEASLDNESGFVILKQINLGPTPSIIPIFGDMVCSLCTASHGSRQTVELSQ
jgi:hypothetical protein